MHLVDASGNWWDLNDEIPEYVKHSLCAWARLHCNTRSTSDHVPESHYRANDPTYDPDADWLDEPFPEEYQ